MKSLLATVVLAGLPFVAGADETASTAQCAEVAERFSAAPRSLGIGELDQLRTCITLQKDATLEAKLQQEQQAQVAVLRFPKSLQDDF
jgi:hypothetical protein